ncbi:MAG: hypothetical protein ACFFG0_22250 [Candidatus Thorarchaeota archaeon]
MGTATKKNKRKRKNALTFVKVEYVSVPDADERLSRVVKILLSNYKNDAKEALTVV